MDGQQAQGGRVATVLAWPDRYKKITQLERPPFKLVVFRVQANQQRGVGNVLKKSMEKLVFSEVKLAWSRFRYQNLGWTYYTWVN